MEKIHGGNSAWVSMRPSNYTNRRPYRPNEELELIAQMFVDVEPKVEAMDKAEALHEAQKELVTAQWEAGVAKRRLERLLVDSSGSEEWTKADDAYKKAAAKEHEANMKVQTLAPEEDETLIESDETLIESDAMSIESDATSSESDTISIRPDESFKKAPETNSKAKKLTEDGVKNEAIAVQVMKNFAARKAKPAPEKKVKFSVDN